jgi:hypothetical protein
VRCVEALDGIPCILDIHDVECRGVHVGADASGLCIVWSTNPSRVIWRRDPYVTAKTLTELSINHTRLRSASGAADEYLADLECPKCGHDEWVGPEYVKRATVHSMEPHEMWKRDWMEALKFTCELCSYERYEPTKDAKP